jgi:hypothetical protein
VKVKTRETIVYENGWQLVRIGFDGRERPDGPRWGVIDNNERPATNGVDLRNRDEAIAHALRLIAARRWGR